MLDDFSAAIDPRGMLHVAFNDTNNQVTRSTDKDAGGAFIVESAQLSGPSLYTNVGDVVPAPAAPAVSSASVAGGTLHVSGTGSLPPGNWATDASGDALYPRHGMNGPGPNAKPVDLTAAWLTGSKDLTAHLRFNGAPGIPFSRTCGLPCTWCSSGRRRGTCTTRRSSTPEGGRSGRGSANPIPPS